MCKFGMHPIGTSETPGEVAASVMEKIDLSGAAQALSQRSLRKLKPEKDDPIPFPLNKEEQYKYDLDKYNDAIQQRNKTMTTFASGAKDIMAANLKYSVSKSDLDKRVAELCQTSVKYTDVSRKLRYQSELKADMFKKLNASLEKLIDINADLLHNQLVINRLQDKTKVTKYNPDLEAALYDMRDQSLKRLKWIEYQLIKAYEYTTLRTYTDKMPCSSILKDKYEGRKNTIQPKDVDGVVNDLFLAYQAQQMKMGQSILADPNANKYFVEDGYPRKITLVGESGKNVLSNQLLDEANRKGYFIIDLQKDLVREVIHPDESHILLSDIMLNEVVFEGGFPANASYQIKWEVLDEGVMRNDKDLLAFKTGDPQGVSDVWTWTIYQQNGKEIISPSSASKIYAETISFIVDPNLPDSDKKKASRFTLAPAWSRAKVSIIPLSGTLAPKIKKLDLGVQCDRQVLGTVQNYDPTLDIKMQDAPLGAYFTAIINKDTTKSTNGFYGVFDNGKQVKLKISNDIVGNNNKFVKWQVYNLTGPNTDYTDREITITLNGHKRVVAIFENSNNNTSQSTKPVIIYEKPSEKSEILMNTTMDHVIILDNQKDSNGFIHVAYNGIQEGYMKSLE